MRGCGAKIPPGPDSLDAFFRHLKDKHEAESDGGSWRRVKIWARKGIDLAPNPQYWAPANEPILPSRPSTVQNLDEEDMKEPFKAARWVARTAFQSLIAKVRPVRERCSSSGPTRGRGRGTSRGRGARSGRGAHRSGPGSGSESQGELYPQTVTDSGSGSDSRGRDPAPQRGRSRGTGRDAGPSRATAPSVDQADESSSKTAPGLWIALKLRKEPKRKRSHSRSQSSDRRKRHSGQSGSEDAAYSSEGSVIPKQPKLPSSATRITTPRPSGAGSTYTRRVVGDDAEPLGGRRPGDGTVPSSALPVEMLDGQLVYEGTPDEPIIRFESCRAELKGLGKAMRLWTVDLLEVEIAGLKDKSRPSDSWSPWQSSLPRLPKWGSPNGWDYWGRPWAYMDAPNRHPDLKVKSAHHKHAARVTIAVLVNCEREPQYFPNLDVAKSAAAAPTWRGHTTRVIDGLGILNPKITVARATRMVQPPHYEGSNVAVESLFSIWDSFRTSKVMWRQNPEMPRGDVTPEGCRRTLTAAQLSEHRPVNSVPPTRPLNPTVKPAAPHMDQAAFPALPPSSHEGIGGIPGTREFPQGTTEGFGAFVKPDQNTVVPRAVPSATSVPSTPTTTATVTSPAVTQAVATTATATTPATSAPAVVGKTNLDPKVSVLRLSPKILESARAKLAAKSDPNRSGQGKASSKGSSTEEPMDCESSHVSRDRSTSHVRTHRSRSHSTHGDKDRKGAEGKTSSTPKASGSKESDKKSSRTGPVAVSEMLLKAGGAKALGKSVGPIPRHSHDWEYKVDYSREPCPPPAFQLDQPGGSHLEESHDKPKSTWRAHPRMSLATLQDNLQAIAQAGSRHALYRSQQGMLRTCSEAFHVWQRSNEVFRHMAHESAFLDEAVAGNVMATRHELQRCNTTLKTDLKLA